MVGITFIYINKNNAMDFSDFTKSSMIFIDIKNNDMVISVGKQLTDEVQVGGFAFDKNLLISSSIMVSSIMGGISALASLLIFIGSVMFIRFIIWNNILKEYRFIGIYKALGFSRNEIHKLYIIGYSLIAFVGSSIGAIFSIPVLNYTASKILKYIGNFNVTIWKIKENTSIWMGFPKSDITISSPIGNNVAAYKEALQEVKKDKRVKNYVYGSIALAGKVDVVLDTKKYPIKSTLYGVMAMNSYKVDLDSSIINGQSPQNPKEIAITLKISQEAGLSVGDYMELSINNKKSTYLISGTYNSMNDNGYGIRVLSPILEKEFPEFIGSEIFVNLKDGNDKQVFEKEINEKYANLDASDIHPMIKPVIESISSILLSITNLLIIVFIAFSSIIILNIIIMNIRDNRRNFGIMKALGFTYKDIRNRYLYRISILTSFSIVIASTLNIIFGNKIFEVAVGLDALIISPVTMLILITLMVILISAITFTCCRTIKNMKPTELMEE